MTDELLFRYFADEASEVEVGQILEWLESDPEAQTHFDAAHDLFNISKLNAAKAGTRARKAVARILFRRIAVAAAACGIIVGAGLLGSRIGENRTMRECSTAMNRIYVEKGERMTLNMPDGTKVTMNGDSWIEYPAMFSSERRNVRFSGQAIFDVSKDAERPFVVNTDYCDIQVLGTRFELISDKKTDLFATSLFNGSVRLADRNGSFSLTMSPSQKVEISGGKIHRTFSLNDNDYLWKDGIISLEGASFDRLMRRFERSFGVTIVNTLEKQPEVRFISGKFYASEGIESALKNLQQGCDFSFRRETGSDVVTIF